MRQVRLSLDHTSNRIKYYAGATVLLPDEEAEWVIRQTGAFRIAQEEATKPVIKVEEDVLE